jgi:hypothetical protein
MRQLRALNTAGAGHAGPALMFHSIDVSRDELDG